MHSAAQTLILGFAPDLLLWALMPRAAHVARSLMHEQCVPAD